MAKLYELTEECEQLYQMLEELDPESENGAEMYQACLDTLEGIQGEFEDKVESIAVMIKRMAADVNALKEEKKKLVSRLNTKESTADQLKDYLLFNFQKLGKSKVETTKAVVSIRNNAESVKIENPQQFVEWALSHNNTLLTYKEPEISKTAVKNALKAGDDLPGAELVRTQTIQIK